MGDLGTVPQFISKKIAQVLERGNNRYIPLRLLDLFQATQAKEGRGEGFGCIPETRCRWREQGEITVRLPTSKNRGVRDRVTNFQKQGVRYRVTIFQKQGSKG